MKNVFRTIVGVAAFGLLSACGAMDSGPPEAHPGSAPTIGQQPDSFAAEAAVSQQPAETSYRPGDCCYALCYRSGAWDGPFNRGRLPYGTCTENAARFCQDHGYYASHPFWDRCN